MWEENFKKIYQESEEKMKKTIEKIHTDFATLRSGKASPTLLDGVKVEYYGTLVPLKQVASILIPEPRKIEIKPWDKTLLQEIEKAILKANIGLTPQNDGKVIHLNLPPLTEERRKELAKIVKKMAEDFRISLRNERREAVEILKKAEKNKEIPEDDLFKYEEQIQKLTEGYMKKVDELLALKEKEIFEV
ncbi:MAG TPA: ribosome recycling factor [Elusimicrobia bacterium]|jgi:ribosome recycling factor|nr:ribosome recycling factor [Elusimicrobiota bacterium]